MTTLTSADNGWGSNVRSFDLSERAWSLTEAARLEVHVTELAMDVAVGFYRPNLPGCTTRYARQLEPPSPLYQLDRPRHTRTALPHRHR